MTAILARAMKTSTMTSHSDSYCEHCGAKVVQHKHGLSKGLLRGLVKFSKRGEGAINLNRCKMTLSEQTNFYKLKYWGIVQKAGGNEHSGEWKLTPEGWRFLRGEISFHHSVRTFRGQVVGFSGKEEYIYEVTDGWRLRPDYIRDMRPHRPGRDLFDD